MITLVSRSLVFVLILLAGAVRAEVVENMYSSSVPLADQSSGELARAAREALSEVFVRVSGSANVLRNPAVSAALGSAASHVQQYSYSKDPNSGGLVVRPVFDEKYVNDLIINAGEPLWTANRPAVLLWLVMEDAAGRQFVNADTAPALVAAVRAEFARRGVPLQLPFYDLVDTSAVTPDQAWGPLDPALISASQRYHLQNVLVGRFSLPASGGVDGDWSYYYEDTQSHQSGKAASEEEFLRTGVAMVAEAMAARYAVSASGVEGEISLSVTGVTAYADYAAVVAWLESLELVERANLVSVSGDTITLTVQAQADASQLAATIELNEKLVPLPAAGPGVQLTYQWQK